MVPKIQGYQGKELSNKTSPVNVLPALFTVIDGKSTDNWPNDDNNKDKAVTNCNSDMSVLVWHEFCQSVRQIERG